MKDSTHDVALIMTVEDSKQGQERDDLKLEFNILENAPDGRKIRFLKETREYFGIPGDYLGEIREIVMDTGTSLKENGIPLDEEEEPNGNVTMRFKGLSWNEMLWVEQFGISILEMIGSHARQIRQL